MHQATCLTTVASTLSVHHSRRAQGLLAAIYNWCRSVLEVNTTLVTYKHLAKRNSIWRTACCFKHRYNGVAYFTFLLFNFVGNSPMLESLKQSIYVLKSGRRYRRSCIKPVNPREKSCQSRRYTRQNLSGLPRWCPVDMHTMFMASHVIYYIDKSALMRFTTCNEL